MRHQTTNRLLSSLAVAAILLGACAAPATQAPAAADAATAAPEVRQMEIFSWWTNGGEADGLNEMFKIFTPRIPALKL